MLASRSIFLSTALAVLFSPAVIAQCPGNDSFEPNDSCDQAAPLVPAFFPGMAGLDDDVDWFSVDVGPGQRVEASIFLAAAQGNLDMVLIPECLDAAPVVSQGTGDFELVAWTNYSANTISVAFAVERVASPPGCNSYDLILIVGADPLAPIGQSFCQSTPNSTGQPATMLTLGSTSAGAQELRLVAAPLPAGANGIFYYGSQAGSTPLGQGFACASGTVLRLPVQQADGAGTLVLDVDYDQLPTGGAIVAGSTWYFSAWFRDPGLSPPFQLADGREILFTP